MYILLAILLLALSVIHVVIVIKLTNKIIHELRVAIAADRSRTQYHLDTNGTLTVYKDDAILEMDAGDVVIFRALD